MKTDTNLSRRRLLASMPAAAAVMAPLAASALCRLPIEGDDPIFAAIKAHRDAMLGTTMAHNDEHRLGQSKLRGKWTLSAYTPEPPQDCKDPPEWIAAQYALRDAHDHHEDALYEFLTTVPVTIAGLLAALDHAASPMWPDEEIVRQNDTSNTDTVLFDAWGAGDDDLVEAAAQWPAMIASTLRALLAV